MKRAVRFFTELTFTSGCTIVTACSKASSRDCVMRWGGRRLLPAPALLTLPSGQAVPRGRIRCGGCPRAAGAGNWVERGVPRMRPLAQRLLSCSCLQLQHKPCSSATDRGGLVVALRLWPAEALFNRGVRCSKQSDECRIMGAHAACGSMRCAIWACGGGGTPGWRHCRHQRAIAAPFPPACVPAGCSCEQRLPGRGRTY